jgi:hypothetical protein
MRTPKTTTLLWLAGGFFLLAAISVPTYYPAPLPVLGADGSPVLGAGGKPLLHRDMASFHRMLLPGYVSIFCFFISSAWLLVRVLRLAYDHFTQNAGKS